MILAAGNPLANLVGRRLCEPDRRAAVDRKFWPILLFSLAAHGLVLAWFGGLPVTPPALPKIVAHLRLVVSPAVSAASEPLLAASATATPAPASQKARPLPPRQELRSVPARAEAAVPPADAPVRLAEQASPSFTPPPVVAERAPSVVDAPPPVARPQGPLLDAYRQRLSDLFASQQQYPRVAALRGWEGQVRLRLRVARKGSLIAVQLDQSSGFEVLDQHAVAMLEQLAALPPFPEGLENQEIQVVVPINYKLKKST